MNRVTINGITYTGAGSISVINGVVTIDGKRQDGTVSGVVEIRVLEGTISELTTDASVSCGDVTGNVRAGGSANCRRVGGSVNAGGSVNCDAVGGSVTAGGSVNHG